MEKQKMTIHRALSELKIIDDRILNGIAAIKPVGLIQKGKKIAGIYDKDDFENEAKSNLQSIESLIKRKTSIKSAIVSSNSVTKVLIGGSEMTVADAITFKSIVDLKRKLVSKLQNSYTSSVSEMNTHNEKVEENSLKLASAALSKDNVKIGDNDVDAITKPYIENNSASLVDPLKVEDFIKKTNEELSAFESEVDSVLSESNAVTFIEV